MKIHTQTKQDHGGNVLSPEAGTLEVPLHGGVLSIVA